MWRIVPLETINTSLIVNWTAQKQIKKNHGKGLTNVREIVERNSGFCNITAEKDSFTVDIYIPLLTERGKSL